MKGTLALVAAAAFGIGLAHAQPPSSPTTADIVQRVEQAGYTQIREVEFDDGLWEVKALAPDGRRVELYVDPAGELIDPLQPPALSAADVAAHLQAQGYTRVRDIELDDGRYEVEAVNPAGRDVDLKVHPNTGAILKETLDD